MAGAVPVRGHRRPLCGRRSGRRLAAGAAAALAPPRALLFAAAVHAAAAASVVPAYWIPEGSVGLAAKAAAGIGAALAWSPWPVGVPLAVWTATAGVGGALFVILFHDARRPSRVPNPDVAGPRVRRSVGEVRAVTR